MLVLKDYQICCKDLRSALNDKKLPVEDLKDFGTFGLKWKVGGFGFLEFDFCPWCGVESSNALNIRFESAIISKQIKEKDVDSDLKKQIWWEKKKEEYLREHGINDDLKEDIEEDVPIVYRSNIRTFGILKTKKFSLKETLESIKITKERLDFVPINYCYQCGAKFPERLDEKLTEILQKEYGLTSWKDYKKAPPEFHTDEWWVKRGL